MRKPLVHGAMYIRGERRGVYRVKPIAWNGGRPIVEWLSVKTTAAPSDLFIQIIEALPGSIGPVPVRRSDFPK